MNSFVPWVILGIVVVGVGAALPGAAQERFDGRFYRGAGDVEYVQLLDISRRMFSPDAEFQNMPMLYMPAWDGFVEGPTWGAWWIQNSYGPTYCALPFYEEPFVTFLQNSQDLWFNLMGDGKRKGANDWVAPDGCLCDAAAPGLIYYKQGDGRINIHDWGMEFTAAGVVMQSELLLISRDAGAIAHYLPMLERSANFIETRRDPKNNLFLAGAAGNLLAPNYAGWLKPDGTYDKAYLAGLSITYIAALDRLIELEKLAGNTDKAAMYAQRRDLARQGLPALTTDEGYFIKYLDPDGTRHGVYGAPKHGYFEAVSNHDAIAFRVVDDAQAMKIYDKIASIPGLRPYDLIVTNCPSLDDMYEKPAGLWEFGNWTNGGHWTTCEARMMMGYYRLGKYEDARRSMRRILDFARRFRMDNNLTKFGSDVYQPKEPINLTYDIFGAPAALIRGLFEYLYNADGVKLMPHIPPTITQLEQRLPIRFGTKKLYLATAGTGTITAVRINGQPWPRFDGQSVSLPYGETPETAKIQIALGNTPVEQVPMPEAAPPAPALKELDKAFQVLPAMLETSVGNRLPLRIGADSNGQNRFVGEIARVRVFDAALDDGEVAGLSKGEFGPHKPLAEWSFASPQNGPFPAKTVENVEMADAPGGKVVRLSGAGYLEVAHDAKLDFDDAFALEARICPGSLPASGARIIDKVPAGTDNGYLLDTCPGNSLRLITRYGSLNYDAKLQPGVWYDVAATCDPDGRPSVPAGGPSVPAGGPSVPAGGPSVPAGEMRLYVNGQRVAAAPCKPVASAVTKGVAAFERLRDFHARLAKEGLGDSYEARHAALAVEYVATIYQRREMEAAGAIKPLPEPSQSAAEKSYVDTAVKLCDGLETALQAYSDSGEPAKKRIGQLWRDSEKR